jgi:hypothetical protein
VTRFSYILHRVLAGILLLLAVLAIANYYFDFGFFARGAKGVMLAVIGLMLIYAAYFVPSRDDVKDYEDAPKPPGADRNA